MLAAVAAVAVLPPGVAQSQQWWGCPVGYAFEVRPDQPQMRCIKHPKTQYRPAGCPTLDIGGSGLKTDVVADRDDEADVCVVGSSQYSAKPDCARGYRLEIRQGPDRCALHLPGSVVAPQGIVGR